MIVATAIQQYEESMDVANKTAYEIAKKQLESSFDIEKSIGFQEFIQSQNIELIEEEDEEEDEEEEEETKCQGCITNQQNQLAHMEEGGCLYEE